MTTATKKKGVVSLKGKIKVIRETENGKKYLEKNRTKIISAFEQNGPRIKRFRKPK
jgi:hypothetical protein